MLLDDSPLVDAAAGCVPSPFDETRAILFAHAERSLSRPVAEVLVEQAIRVGEKGDFSLKLAALQGMLARYPRGPARVRRLDGRHGGRLRVRIEPADEGDDIQRSVPSGGTTQEVWLEGTSPLAASCGCTDFARSGLGVCEHVFAALLGPGKAGARKGRRTDGVSETARFRCGRVSAEAIRCDPLIPLRGNIDRIQQLSIDVSGRAGKRLRALLAVATTGPLGQRSRSLAHLADLPPGVLCSPLARVVLTNELARTEVRHAAERGARVAIDALSSLRRSLYPYQEEAVRRFLGKGALLIADDMGLGKTTQAIAACHALVHGGVVSRVLLVVPASLKPQWRREWQASTDVSIQVVDGPRTLRCKAYDAERGVLVVGYEQLRLDFELIQAFGPEMVVLDEAQRIKNPATKTAKAVMRLTPRYRLALSGTPMQNRLSELASVVGFVDPEAVGPAWQMVARHTFESGNAAAGESGARFLDELRARLAPVMVRRLRKEVLSQLPSRTDTRIPVPLTPEQVAVHHQLDEPIRTLMRIRKDRPLTKRERERLMMLLGEQRRVCNGLVQCSFEASWPILSPQAPTPALLETLDAPKLAAFVELVRVLAVDQRRKIVVFSEWRAMLRLAEWAVRDVLRGAGLTAGFFTGRETPKMRERALVDFHDEPSLAVLFLTDAGGVGLNLQRAASACIQLELPWNPAVMEQRIGRIHRLGQNQPIDVFHVVSEGGLESKIAGLLGRKKALSTALLDENEVEVRFATGAGIFDLAVSLEAPDQGEPDEPEEELAPEEASPHPTESVARSPAGVASPASPESVLPSPMGITRRADGGFTFDVPPELAQPMARLLAAMMQSLSSSLPPATATESGPQNS